MPERPVDLNVHDQRRHKHTQTAQKSFGGALCPPPPTAALNCTAIFGVLEIGSRPSPALISYPA
eukprot:3013215-Prymnesium_polylepis.2